MNDWLRMGLGRPFDLRLVSNRVALTVPVLAGAVAGAWALAAGVGLSDAVRWGIHAGGASFLAWATGRELDPDRPMSANAAAVAAPWLVLWGSPALAAGGLWLLAIRAVAGTTGAGPYRFDMLLVGGLATWAAAGDRGLAAAIAGLMVVGLSTLFEPRGRRVALVGAIGFAVVSTVIAVAGTRALAPVAVSAAAIGWIAAIAVVLVAALPPTVTATTDRREEPLSRTRVRSALAAAALWGVVAVVWHGAVGVAVAGPTLVALAVAGLLTTFSKQR